MKVAVKENLWKTRCVNQFDFLDQSLCGVMTCSGQVQIDSGAHLSSGYRGRSPWGQSDQGHESGHALPSVLEIKNCGATPFAHMSLWHSA
jgi:hypothetical protein